MTTDKWDGKISNLKISEYAFPELHQELSRMQHKERGDRLRSLALLGLFSLKCWGNGAGFILTASQQLSEGEWERLADKVPSRVDSSRSKLKSKLLGSV